MPVWPDSVKISFSAPGSLTAPRKSPPVSENLIGVTNFGYPQISRPAAHAAAVVTGKSTMLKPTRFLSGWRSNDRNGEDGWGVPGGTAAIATPTSL